jgi:hypothetical protein
MSLWVECVYVLEKGRDYFSCDALQGAPCLPFYS